MSTNDRPPPRNVGTRAGEASRAVPEVAIRELAGAAEMGEAVELLMRVWGSPTELVRLEMMMAISHSGGYVTGAFRTATDGSETMVGTSVAILARYRDRPALHSHVTGLLPDVRHAGLGRAIKLHQLAWAAARELDWIVWTFDPLVRRNAWFNIGVLGVEVHAYLDSFYGEMTDAINAGDRSDRLLVGWHVPTAGPDSGRDGSDAGVDARRVPTPDDVVSLRRTDPAAVARWRERTRAELSGALAAGQRVLGFTRAGEYVIGSPP